MPKSSPSNIVIIAFSPIRRDARVLRQAEYLSKHFSVVVIGYGKSGVLENIGVPLQGISASTSVIRRLRSTLLLPLGKLTPRVYDAWYWSKPDYQTALHLLLESKANFIHANDWHTLPIAVEAARRLGAQVVLDLHEYAPLEMDNIWYWRTFYKPMIDYFLRKYISQVSATITVNQSIAERYGQEYNFHPVVVMNAPVYPDNIEPSCVNPENIRLVHHGAAIRDRKLELMIYTIAYADPQYSLYFFLIDHSQGYITWLQREANRLAPGRVHFCSALPPEKIVGSLTNFDVGIYLLPPSNYNNSVALPNKFFDFVAAGLPVVIGPSLEMARLIRQYGFGVVSPSFNPKDVAEVLNNLQPDDIHRMKQKAILARKVLNAEVEMGKLVALYQKLVGRL